MVSDIHMWCDLGKHATWWKFKSLSFYYHFKDFNLLFLKLVKFCLYDAYIQSYVLSKLIENIEKHNNFKNILFISAKLPSATCGGFPQIASRMWKVNLPFIYFQTYVLNYS